MVTQKALHSRIVCVKCPARSWCIMSTILCLSNPGEAMSKEAFGDSKFIPRRFKMNGSIQIKTTIQTTSFDILDSLTETAFGSPIIKPLLPFDWRIAYSRMGRIKKGFKKMLLKSDFCMD